MFTPAGWTRKYAVHTSANFERAKDKKIVAKVLVTCEFLIFGLGSHSATGDEWAAMTMPAQPLGRRRSKEPARVLA